MIGTFSPKRTGWRSVASGSAFGAAKEREVAEMLEADGWLVGRAAGSHGPADLAALAAGRTSMLIQVKAHKALSVFSCFPPTERLRLSAAAKQAGARAFLCRWRSAHRRWDLIPEEEWPALSKRGQPDFAIIDGHWIWQKALTPDGYGIIGRKGACLLAHRWYYEHARGLIPEGLQIDHLCRIRSCVNPDHLEPVTQGENRLRGRLTKLTPSQVRAVRESTEPSAIVAERFGITRGYVWRLRTRQVRHDVA